MTLHDAIVVVLRESGGPMTTSEIARVLNGRALYTKRDGSPIDAFQVHGRTRNYDQLFQRSGSTVALVEWGGDTPTPTGPAASLRGAPSQAEAIAVVAPTADPIVEEPIRDHAEVERSLLDPAAFRLAGGIDAYVPDLPGLYAVRLAGDARLPAPFDAKLADRGHDLLYIGIATGSLRKRFVGQELRARGHGTFFRSLGAVLGFRPSKGSLVGKANQSNYRFTSRDEDAIRAWIDDHLLVNWIQLDGNLIDLERVLIAERRPLLNLDHNPAALAELRFVRRECRTIANVTD